MTLHTLAKDDNELCLSKTLAGRVYGISVKSASPTDHHLHPLTKISVTEMDRMLEETHTGQPLYYSEQNTGSYMLITFYPIPDQQYKVSVISV